MAIGLIKKQIIHSTGQKSAPLRKTKNQQRLEDAETEYNKQMAAYSSQEFINPYAKNVFEGMENTMQNLTINQKQAQFEAQQMQQSQANILNAMQAGGNFNAGNIQALANQAQISAQKASASIGQQEAANRKLAAQEASRLQTLERKGRLQQQQGVASTQQLEMDRQATMLGMSMQQVGNAQQAIAARQQMIGNIIGGVTSAFGSIYGGKLAGS